MYALAKQGIDEENPQREEIACECRSRMVGVGAGQYDYGSEQAFERMTPRELLEGAREELLDLINYAGMTIYRIDQTISRVKRAELKQATPLEAIHPLSSRPVEPCLGCGKVSGPVTADHPALAGFLCASCKRARGFIE